MFNFSRKNAIAFKKLLIIVTILCLFSFFKIIVIILFLVKKIAVTGCQSLTLYVIKS